MKNKTQRQLIEGVKAAVAKYGVSGANTRLIAQEAGVNDAIIYYYFKDRDSLLAKTYEIESGLFLKSIVEKIFSVRRTGVSLSVKLKCNLILRTAWRYLLEHPDMCRFCSYYYHSPAFYNHSLEQHKAEVDLLMREIEKAFPDYATAERCLYAVFNQLYEFAMMVLNGKLEDTEATELQVFGVLYSIIRGQLDHSKP